MRASDSARILRSLREVDLDDARTTFRDVRAASKQLATFDNGVATLTRMRGQSPWERHVKGDELFYVISGAIRFRLLTRSRERAVDVTEGGVFVVPRGVWHRSRAQRGTTVLVVRATEHGPVTFVDDPRKASKKDFIA